MYNMHGCKMISWRFDPSYFTGKTGDIVLTANATSHWRKNDVIKTSSACWVTKLSRKRHRRLGFFGATSFAAPRDVWLVERTHVARNIVCLQMEKRFIFGRFFSD